MARYIMTARRKAALRKAQLASARKRRGKNAGRKKAYKKAAVGVLGLAATGGAVIGVRHAYNRNFYHGKETYTGHANRGIGYIEFINKKSKYRSERTKTLRFAIRQRGYDKSYHRFNIHYDPYYASTKKRAWHGGRKIRYGY